MIERLKLIMTNKGLNSSKFADEIGVQRSAISHIISGRNKPSLEFMQKVIQRFPEIRIEWLMNGEGNVYKNLELFVDEEIIKPTPEKEMKDEPKKIEDKKTERVISKNKASLSPTLPAEKKIEKIIVFYTDKKFEIYYPD